jgi:STAM-binding protein
VPEALAIMERLKPRLEVRHRSYVESRLAKYISSSPGRRKDAPAAFDLSSKMYLNGPFSPPQLNSPLPHDIDSRNLALDIARQEYEKREREKRERRLREARNTGGVILDHTGREILRVGTPAAPDFPYKRIFGGPPPFETPGQRAARQAREEKEDDEDLIETIKAISMGIDPTTLPPRGSRTSYQFPDFSKRDSISAYDFEGFPQEPPSPVTMEPTAGRWTASYPAVPKPQHISPPPYSPAATPLLPPPPPPPPKIPSVPAPPPKIRESPPAPALTLADATHSKDFSTPATLESGEPLRTMFLPSTLRQTFLALAEPNTNANLETCGILCGTLIQNALFVSRLVIPEQEATSDTCATKDEEAFFEYCNREELMVLGWIHTHPSQTCFMSSVDLHTHAGYQLMMKESIAIVCAPSKNPS